MAARKMFSFIKRKYLLGKINICLFNRIDIMRRKIIKNPIFIITLFFFFGLGHILITSRLFWAHSRKQCRETRTARR